MVNLDIVLEDFKTIGDSIRKKVKEAKVKPSRPSVWPEKKEKEYDEDLDLLVEISPSGLVWYHNICRAFENQGWGPQDYISIRDDVQKLQDFLADLLDYETDVEHWAQDVDIFHHSDYATWFYKHCDYEPFQEKFIQATITLLEEEVEKSFLHPDLQKGKSQAKKIFNDRYAGDIVRVFGGWDMSSFFPYGEKMKYPETEEEKRIAKMLEKERKNGPVEELEKAVFRHASPEFKQAFEAFYLEREAQLYSHNTYAHQFTRLIGLLEVVWSCGNPGNGFAKATPILKPKLESNFLHDMPDVRTCTDYKKNPLCWGRINLSKLIQTAYGTITQE